MANTIEEATGQSLILLDTDPLTVLWYTALREACIRIGKPDLKIASSALLLSANLRDFHKVPGLRVEN